MKSIWRGTGSSYSVASRKISLQRTSAADVCIDDLEVKLSLETIVLTETLTGH